MFRTQARQLSLVCRSLEAAAEEAAGYIEEKQRSYNPWTHAAVARMHVRDLVVSRGHDLDMTQRDLANCGVLLGWVGHRLHVRKSDHGKPAAPGRSKWICSLYNQGDPRQMALGWSDNPLVTADQDSFVYILHWLSRGDGRLKDLFLAYPTVATRSTVNRLWNEPVPDYIRFGFETPSTDAPEASEDNLPFIVLPDEQQRYAD